MKEEGGKGERNREGREGRKGEECDSSGRVPA
jgi:hypothetical protein